MSSSKNSASAQAARQYGQLAREGYGLGMPALDARNAALMPALRQAQAGELPAYMQEAFNVQRTGLQEGIANQERSRIQTQDAAAKRNVAGGNLNSTMNPAQMGQILADAMTGSRVQQGMATINQANSLMSMGLGGAGQTGNAAIGAAGNNLQAIGMLPNYNPTYAAVLGGVNAAGSIYGAGKQSGWWDKSPAGFNGVDYAAQMPGLASAQWGIKP
jgi:hypothetical protein